MKLKCRLLSRSYAMDRLKYLARLEDDVIAQNVFADLGRQKGDHHRRQLAAVSSVLERVVADKQRQAQESQVKTDLMVVSDFGGGAEDHEEDKEEEVVTQRQEPCVFTI